LLIANIVGNGGGWLLAVDPALNPNPNSIGANQIRE
jgi:hypothetical protein